MRKLVAATAVAATMGASVAVPTPAVAHDNNHHRCVTDHEHRHVLNGWHTKREIHRGFDFDGWRVTRNGDIMVRQYRACPRSGDIASQVYYVRLEDGTWLAFDKDRF